MSTHWRTPVVPASFFGIVLGLCGLGNAWRAAHAVWGLPAEVGEALQALGCLVWLVLVFLYVAKWFHHRAQAIEELHHPVQCCFIGLLGVATLLVANAAHPYSHAAAELLLIVGIIYTAAFAVWRTGGLWQGGRDAAHTTAVLYLPTVAGSFVAAAVLAVQGHAEWGQLMFGAGVFSWLAIESVLVHRLFTSPELAIALRPTLGIQLAPPAVGAVAYLSVTQGKADLAASMLLGYALLQACVLLRTLPWIRQQPFSASYWAFTFGVTALATAPLRMAERGDHGPAMILAPLLFTVANVVVGVVAIGTLGLLIRGRLMPATTPASASAPEPDVRQPAGTA